MQQFQQKVSVINNLAPQTSVNSASSRLQSSNAVLTKEYFKKALGNVDSYNPQVRVNTTNTYQSQKQQQILLPKENVQIASNLPYNFHTNTISNIFQQKNATDQVKLQQMSNQAANNNSILPPQPSTRPSNLNIVIKKDKDYTRPQDNFFSAREGAQQRNKNPYQYQQFINLNENTKNSTISQKIQQEETMTASQKIYKANINLSQIYQQTIGMQSTASNQNAIPSLPYEIGGYQNHIRQTSALSYGQNNLKTNPDTKGSVEIQSQDKKESIQLNYMNNQPQLQERKNSVYYQRIDNIESESNQNNNISTYRNIYLEQHSSSNRQQNLRNNSLLASQDYSNNHNQPVQQFSQQQQQQQQQSSYYYQQQNGYQYNNNYQISSQREYISINQQLDRIPSKNEQNEEYENNYLQNSQKPNNVLQHQTKKLMHVVNNGRIENVQQNYFQQIQPDSSPSSLLAANQFNLPNYNPITQFNDNSDKNLVNTYNPSATSRRPSIKQDNPLTLCELTQSGSWNNSGNVPQISHNGQHQFPVLGDNRGYQPYSYINPPKVIRQRHKTTINHQEQNLRNIKTSSNNLSIYQQTAQTNRSYDIITNNQTLENSFINEITPTSTRSIQNYQMVSQYNQYYLNQPLNTQNSSATRVSQNFNNLNLPNQGNQAKENSTHKIESENTGQNYLYNQESIQKQVLYTNNYNKVDIPVIQSNMSGEKINNHTINSNQIGVKNISNISQQNQSYSTQIKQNDINSLHLQKEYTNNNYQYSSNTSIAKQPSGIITHEPLSSHRIIDQQLSSFPTQAGTNLNTQDKYITSIHNTYQNLNIEKDKYYQINNYLEKEKQNIISKGIDNLITNNNFSTSNQNIPSSIVNYTNDILDENNYFNKNLTITNCNYTHQYYPSTHTNPDLNSQIQRQTSISGYTKSNGSFIVAQEQEKNFFNLATENNNDKIIPNIISHIPYQFKQKSEDLKLQDNQSLNKQTGIRKSSKSAYLQSTQNDDQFQNVNMVRDNQQKENIETIERNTDINTFSFKQKRNNSILIQSHNMLAAIESEIKSSNEHQIPNQSKQVKLSLKSQLTALNITQNKTNSSNNSGNYNNINNNSSNNPLKVSVQSNKRKSSKSFIQPNETIRRKNFGEDQILNQNNEISKQETQFNNKQNNNNKTRGFNTQTIKNLLVNVNEVKSLSNSNRQNNSSKNSNLSSNNQQVMINTFSKQNISSTQRIASNNDSKSNININKQLEIKQQKDTNQIKNMKSQSTRTTVTQNNSGNLNLIQNSNNNNNSNYQYLQDCINNLEENNIKEQYNNNQFYYQKEIQNVNLQKNEEVTSVKQERFNMNRISFHCNNPYLDQNQNEVIPIQQQQNKLDNIQEQDCDVKQVNYTSYNNNEDNQYYNQQPSNSDYYQIKQNDQYFTNQSTNNLNSNDQNSNLQQLSSSSIHNQFSYSTSEQNSNLNKKGSNVLSGFLSKNNSKKQISKQNSSSTYSNQNPNDKSGHSKSGSNNSLVLTINNLGNQQNEPQKLDQIYFKKSDSSQSQKVRNSFQFINNVLSSKNSSENLNNYSNSNGNNNINTTNRTLQAVSKSLKGSFITVNHAQCNTTRDLSSSNRLVSTSSNACVEDELNKQKKRFADQEIKLSQFQEFQKQSKPMLSSKHSTKGISKQNQNSQRSQSEYEYRQFLDQKQNGLEIVNKIHEKCNDLNEKQNQTKQDFNPMTFCNKQQQFLLNSQADSNFENNTNNENIPPSYFNQQIYSVSSSIAQSNNSNPLEKLQQKFNQKQFNKSTSIPHMANLHQNNNFVNNYQNNFTNFNVHQTEKLQNAPIIKSSSLGLYQDSISPFSQPYSSTTTSTSPHTASSPLSLLNILPSNQSQNYIQVNFKQGPPSLTIEEQIQMFEIEDKFKKNEKWLKSVEEMEYLLDTESSYIIDYNYYTKNPQMNQRFRCSLIDWMQRQSMKFNLKRETIHKAIYYFDLYLSKSSNIKEDHIYLIAISCIFIASKQEEIYPPSLNDILSGSQYASQKNIINLQEIAIIECLQWKLNPITGCFWIDLGMAQWDKIQEIKKSFNLTFRLRDEYSYRRYREAYQFLDCLLLDSNKLKYSLRILSVCSIYLVLCKHQGVNPETNNQIDQILSEYNFYQMFSVNSNQIKECSKEYLLLFQNLIFDFELPNAIKLNNFNQRSYEEFLAFQSYTPNNKLAIENQF